jgi:hypothetical protein
VTSGDRLCAGDVLTTGTALVSGEFRLELVDGNLRIRHDTTTLWSTGTSGYPTAQTRIVDGNLKVTSNVTTLWSSGTVNNPGACAILRQDGVLAIQTGTAPPVWTSSQFSATAPALSSATALLLSLELLVISALLLRRVRTIRHFAVVPVRNGASHGDP